MSPTRPDTQASLQSDTARRSLRESAVGLLSPLMIAALVTWGAVWLESVGRIAARDPDLAGPARILLAGFLAGFLLVHFAEGARRLWLCDAGLLVQVACVFGLLMIGPTGIAGVLLVLVGVGFAIGFRFRIAAVFLVAINLGLFAVVHWAWGVPPGRAVPLVAAYVGFQVFALMMVVYAKKAERSAETLREVNAGLMATRSLLAETARDQERLRLSRELHDVAGHQLTALKLNLRALARDPSLAGRRELELATRLADELLDELRSVARQLRASDGIDLAEALARLSEPLPRPRTELSVGPDARVPRAEQADVLLRAAQEALTNAARHGGAERAWIRLGRQGDDLVLSVDDDGRVRWPVVPGQGLTGMQERARALGGEAALSPSPEGGLRVAVRLPLQGDG